MQRLQAANIAWNTFIVSRNDNCINNPIWPVKQNSVTSTLWSLNTGLLSDKTVVIFHIVERLLGQSHWGQSGVHRGHPLRIKPLLHSQCCKSFLNRSVDIAVIFHFALVLCNFKRSVSNQKCILQPYCESLVHMNGWGDLGEVSCFAFTYIKGAYRR